jgi:phage terminase small subunit
MPKSGLTPKQERFIEEYLVDFNGTKAAIRAGYKPGKSAEVQAYQNLRKPQIAQAIEKRRAKLAKAAELTAASVLKDLKSVLDRCMQAEPVLNSDGEETGEFRFNPGGALKAIELQGKFLGMWDGSLARQSEEETEETPEERELRNHALGEVVQLFREKRFELKNRGRELRSDQDE